MIPWKAVSAGVGAMLAFILAGGAAAGVPLLVLFICGVLYAGLQAVVTYYVPKGGRAHYTRAPEGTE